MWPIVAWLLSRAPIRRALITWSFRRPYGDIKKGASVYMRRFWVFNPYPVDPTGRDSRLPSARVHHIMRPDDDRHLHDHPWDARTVILSGWYDEKLASGAIVRRKRGYTGPINFGQYHSIVAVSPGGVWTLFITYRYRGTWGFLVDGAKVKYREYLGPPMSWHDAPEWATCQAKDVNGNWRWGKHIPGAPYVTMPDVPGNPPGVDHVRPFYENDVQERPKP